MSQFYKLHKSEANTRGNVSLQANVGLVGHAKTNRREERETKIGIRAKGIANILKKTLTDLFT
jgi:hypothetical protein